MEIIVLLIGGFILVGWTIGINVRPDFRAATFNGLIVYIWWALFVSIFSTANSFLHLIWAMPLVAFLTLLGAGFGRRFFQSLLGAGFGHRFFQLLLGSIPIFIIFWL